LLLKQCAAFNPLLPWCWQGALQKSPPSMEMWSAVNTDRQQKAALDAGASPAELATLAMRIMDGLTPGADVADARHIVNAVKALDAADYSQVLGQYG
jgi:hypothetical protein